MPKFIISLPNIRLSGGLRSALLASLMLGACTIFTSAGAWAEPPTNTPTPTPTPTNTPTDTPTPTPTPTETPTFTSTPTPTFTPTFTSTPTATPTPFYQGKDLNFVIIIADDQRLDMMGDFMRLTQREIFDKGVQFSRAYITTPECCPSRSSIYTGKYASSHGVVQNSYPLVQQTLFEDLSHAGFYTGLVGKYLNSWNGSPRPEFNFWRSFPFGSAYFIDPIIFRNGRVTRVKGYQIDVIKPDVLEFLEIAAKKDQRFALVYAPFSPHEPAIPAAADRKLFSNLPPYRPPNYGITKDKPAWVKRAGTMPKKKIQFMDALRLKQLRAIQSLDRSVKAILDKLDALNLSDSTVVIYISDNGLLYGEFGLESKSCSYEPAIHVPFAIRIPGGAIAPRVEGKLVSNIDIAPTIRELAGLPADPTADGRSLAPLLTSSDTPWREEIMIEGYRSTETRSPFRSIHTENHVLIENGGDIDELYDLVADPYELNNLAITNPETPVYKDLKGRLNTLDSAVKVRAVIDTQKASRSQAYIGSWKLALRRCRLSRRKCNYDRLWRQVLRK